MLQKRPRSLVAQKNYDRPGQLQRPRTPDLENSRKTAEKGAEWAPGKVPGKQPEKAEKQLFCMLRVFFRLFFGCFPGTSPGPTRHLFRLFFGCFQGPAFGASVAGRADRNRRKNLPFCWYRKPPCFLAIPTLSQNLQHESAVFPHQDIQNHIRNYYLSNSKTFQDGTGNGNFGEINANDFLDGNWESMEMKG